MGEVQSRFFSSKALFIGITMNKAFELSAQDAPPPSADERRGDSEALLQNR